MQPADNPFYRAFTQAKSLENKQVRAFSPDLLVFSVWATQRFFLAIYQNWNWYRRRDVKSDGFACAVCWLRERKA